MAHYPSAPRASIASRTSYDVAILPQAPPPERKLSIPPTTPGATKDNATIDPDELFAKNTIAEVRGVQWRLRADAEAKQEELRLMVGERYRDLLQASASIISMAQSSQRVTDILGDIKEAIASQEEPPLPRRNSLHHSGDTHLHVFQLLSAHMRLLLDAPEHIWRLLERKNFFPAAWLFLLSRVVHRALVKDDEQDGETWASRGVEILEQFPIVQRQWEVVSQLRTQIIHRATLSLREYATTSEDVCATLLTLHILDSRPLTETLIVFLDQRSRALRSSLQWRPDTKKVESSESKQESLDPAIGSPTTFRRIPVRQIKDALRGALDILFKTMAPARQIFRDAEGEVALSRRVLEHIHSSNPSPVAPDTAALFFTSQTLMQSLPSSTQFQMLPQNIKSYKPFVDLNSASSVVSRATLDQRLNGWFSTSIVAFRTVAQVWFNELQSIRELWNIRLALRVWIAESRLEKAEVEELGKLLDEVSAKRVYDIWVVGLRRAETTFQEALDVSLKSIGEENNQADTLESLFHAPLLPAQIMGGSHDPIFKKYKAALRNQLLGRSAILDKVLAPLERCAASIWQDIDHILAADAQSLNFVEQLKRAYQPDAEVLSRAIVAMIDAASNSTSSNLQHLIFVDQVTIELATSSPFIHKIGCSLEVVKGLQTALGALHDRILDQWRDRTILQITGSKHLRCNSSRSEPSPDLFQKLSSLSHSLYQLGLVQRGHKAERDIVSTTVREFILRIVDNQANEEETLHQIADFGLLQEVARSQVGKCDDAVRLLDEKLKAARQGTQHHPSSPEPETSDFLSRTQTLFSPLLGAPTDRVVGKPSNFLLHGAPPADQQYQPPLDLAKSTARFGLLLVGGSMS